MKNLIVNLRSGRVMRSCDVPSIYELKHRRHNKSSPFFFDFFYLILAVFLITWPASNSFSNMPDFQPDLLPCSPESSDRFILGIMPPLRFCEQWNPEFTSNGHHCCRKPTRGRSKKSKIRCSLQRAKSNYCNEMTLEQKQYTQMLLGDNLGFDKTGSPPFLVESPDPLDLISQSLMQERNQAFCTVNNGFLAHGRRLIPSEKNAIRIKSPGRCTEFGTDPMIAMLEWLGRRVHQHYHRQKNISFGPELVVGDISAPRGGCLSGLGGKRGHLSHTTGQDVDLGFINFGRLARKSQHFGREFEPESNWWLLKEIFSNPFACIEVIFLDKTLFKKLGKSAKNDPLWLRNKKIFKHMPGHRNHFHIRIGASQRSLGCEVQGDGYDHDLIVEGDNGEISEGDEVSYEALEKSYLR